MFHRLKLFADDEAANTAKKPVVSETYEEVVFSEPHEGFYSRVMAVAPRPAVPASGLLPLLPRYGGAQEKEEVDKLTAARLRIAQQAIACRQQLEA